LINTFGTVIYLAKVAATFDLINDYFKDFNNDFINAYNSGQ